MTILALEFSSDRRSVAVARDGVLLARAATQSADRATDALGLVEKVLAEGGVSRVQIEVVAVGLGPGSYTGVRAAIAVAQGWQLACGVRLLGVSSLAALAAQAQAEDIFGRVNVLVDAQRGEFYLSEWEISADTRVEVCPVRIITAAERAVRVAACERFVGPVGAEVIYPEAAMVVRLAGGRSDFVAGERLEPIYLRETTFLKAPAPRIE